jgi:hypothetical protein
MRDVLLGLGVLACPIGMGAMMWFMGKGMRGKAERPGAAPQSIEQLREEHRRLGEELERAERTRSSA